MKNQIEVIETDYPVNCPFCDEIIRSDDEDSPCYYDGGRCEHLLFEASDDGFEYRAERFNQHMAIEPAKDALTDDFEPVDEEYGIDGFTNKVTIPGSIKYAIYEGLGGSLMAARLGDGSLLSNNPQALSWFLQMANDANPAGFIAPSTGGDQLTGVQQRLDEIRTIRKKDATRYFSDEKMQAEFRKLLEAEERLASRQ